MKRKLPNVPDLQTVKLELGCRSLTQFVPMVWKWTEPKDYVHGKTIEAICDHLSAVIDGRIRKLIITVPPRHTKSLLTSVFMPAFAWIKKPQLQFLFASYAHNLSMRDSVRCRRVMNSPDYQNLLKYYWGDKPWKFIGDQNTKVRFDNSRNGYRISTSVDGQLTGEGGDIIVVDDPHNVTEAESETVRKGVLHWWDEAMSSRLNDPKTGRYVIIGQRVHEEDLIGHILDRDYNKKWVHLCLPARYEGKDEERTRTPLEKWKSDWRVKENEILWPERFGEEELETLEDSLGPYAAAAQLQQRPAPRTGGMFQPEKCTIVNIPPAQIVESARYWDKAGTQDGGAFTVGMRLDKLSNGQYLISDVVRGQWVASIRERIIRDTAEKDGVKLPGGQYITILLEQEPGSGGKESLENSIRNLAGFKVLGDRVTGDKTTRAEPFSIQFNTGNILVLNATWTKALLHELRYFPMGKFKDQVDAGSGCFNYLARTRKRIGAW